MDWSSLSEGDERHVSRLYGAEEATWVRERVCEETIRDGRTPLLLTKAHLDRGVDETNYAKLVEKGA